VSSKITGLGSYIPELKIPNTHFENHTFVDEKGVA